MTAKYLWVIIFVAALVAYGGLYVHLRYRHFFVHRSNTYGDKITLGEYNASFFIVEGDTLRDQEYYESRSNTVYNLFYPAMVIEEVIRFKIAAIL